MRSLGAHTQSHAPPRQRIAECLNTCAFFVLLLVVAMRPLVSETYESGLHDIAQALGPTGAPDPVLTIWFDLAIWSAILATTLSSILARRPWTWTGLEAGWIIMLIAAVISTRAASNQRSAMTASADWLSALAMLPVLVNLLRDRFRVALLLTVLTVSGVASAAKGLLQITLEYPETRQWYEQTKTELWTKQGIDLNDPHTDRSIVELFERRLAAAEPSGFFHHSNIQGAWLLIAGFAALALANLAGVHSLLGVLASLLALVLLASIWPTGSRGALLAGGTGLILGLLATLIRHLIARYWRATLAVAWCAILAAAAGVWAFGSVRGGLPGASLRFRWNYWQVTWEILAQHLASGVGALNFDRAYLALKPIAFPEEIKDPHNFLLAVLAQWGIVGGLGLGLLLWAASLRFARALARSVGPIAATHIETADNRRLAVRWIVALIVGFVVLRLACLHPTWSSGTEGMAMTFFDLGLYGLVWIVCLGLLLGLAEKKVRGSFPEEAVSPFLPWAVGGVLAFLLHSTIDLAMFHPGTLTAFVALGAVATWAPPVAANRNARPDHADKGRLLSPLRRRLDRKEGVPPFPSRASLRSLPPLATAGAVLVALIVLELIPVGRCAHYLSLARAVRSGPQAVELYENAAAADPLDPTPLAELAELLAAADRPDALALALAVVDQAIERDPRQIALHRLRVRILLSRFGLAGDQDDLFQAINTARSVLDLYPHSPNDHLQFAELLARASVILSDSRFIDQAREHYLTALALDDARDPGELRRWSDARRQWVIQRLQELGPCADTQPGGDTLSSTSCVS